MTQGRPRLLHIFLTFCNRLFFCFTFTKLASFLSVIVSLAPGLSLAVLMPHGILIPGFVSDGSAMEATLH